MAVPYYGDFAEDSVVYIPFNTFDSNDPAASCTITELVAGDVYIHKDLNATHYDNDPATSTVSINLDSITGNHGIAIDTSVDAWFAAGHEYQVRIEGVAVDGGTLNAWVGAFSIERAGGALAIIKGDHGLVSIQDDIDAILLDTGTDGVVLAADAITSAKIADNAFANEHFAAGALTSAEITSAAGCVVASIANDAITAAAIQNGAIDLATFAADCKTGSALKANVETITAGIIANASFNADVGSTAYDTNIIALAARKVLDELNLNHLMKDAVANNADLTAEVVDGTVLANLMAKADGDTSDFNPTTDSLEALRDRGDAAWITATGFSTHSAADVKTAVEAGGSSLAQILEDTGTTLNAQINKMVIALVNKKVVRKTAGGAGEDVGDTDLYTDAGALATSIDQAFSDDGTFVSQKALVVP